MATRTRYLETTAKSRAVLPALLALLAAGGCAGSNPEADFERTDLHSRRIDALETEWRARFYADERTRLDAEQRACMSACSPGYQCTR